MMILHIARRNRVSRGQAGESTIALHLKIQAVSTQVKHATDWVNVLLLTHFTTERGQTLRLGKNVDAKHVSPVYERVRLAVQGLNHSRRECTLG